MKFKVIEAKINLIISEDDSLFMIKNNLNKLCEEKPRDMMISYMDVLVLSFIFIFK